MRLFLVNGASGAGKTTVSKALDGRTKEVTWIHPDGLMDTPNMESEEILRASLSLYLPEDPAATVIIDCQIRPSSVGELVRSHSLEACTAVLLDCPREIREQRLLDRGWSDQDFNKIETWASMLREEAQVAGHRIFDTSTMSVDSIASQIERGLRSDYWSQPQASA